MQIDANFITFKYVESVPRGMKILKSSYAKHYSPKDRWMWDCWFVKHDVPDGDGKWHMFYLQNIKMENPKDRHQVNPEKADSPVTVGHAVSDNLIDWKEVGTAIEPTKFSWDEVAIWTGSIVKKGDWYYKFYTGRNREDILVQKIGLAKSKDLMNWEKVEGPVLEADNVFYHMDNTRNNLDTVPAWRDPFVFKDPKTKKHFMTISARVKGEETEHNACLALAEAEDEDLHKWKLHPPILAPGRYDEMETSQVVYHDDWYYLFFCSHFRGYHPNWAAEHGAWTGLHCYRAKELMGPYEPVNDNGVVMKNGKYVFGVRLLDKEGNDYKSLGWLYYDDDRDFIGKLSKPFKIKIDGDKVYPIDEEDALRPL